MFALNRDATTSMTPKAIGKSRKLNRLGSRYPSSFNVSGSWGGKQKKRR